MVLQGIQLQILLPQSQQEIYIVIQWLQTRCTEARLHRSLQIFFAPAIVRPDAD